MSHWEAKGATDEWFTPPEVFEALDTAFDLDVAAPNRPTHVPTRQWFTATDDGLRCNWRGFVWMNAPFGGRNALVPWLDKFFSHGDGIALTPDRTSAPWFQDAWKRADAVLFTRKIRFVRPDGSRGVSPSTGSALWATGPQASCALDCAFRAGFGILAFPAERLIEAHAARTAA